MVCSKFNSALEVHTVTEQLPVVWVQDHAYIQAVLISLAYFGGYPSIIYEVRAVCHYRLLSSSLQIYCQENNG